jgi:2OG-Fe(II) oxygenase superfamily
MTEPLLQLRRRGLAVANPSDLQRARAEFDARHCVLLPNLLETGLARAVLDALDRGTFAGYTHEGIGKELCAQPGTATGVLELLANDPEFFAAVRTMTGCGPIGLFHGRVYRMVPGGGHYDSWHSDEGLDRLVAMSVNLSPTPYEGGVLQIRENKSSRILNEVANTGFGDAILFRIGPTLTHRVTTVEGSLPKTAYAGWFRSKPFYRNLVRERAERSALHHGLDDGLD